MLVADKKSFHFNYLAFAVGLVIGGIYLYYKSPERKVLVKYPSPYNAGHVTYKDDTDTCFQYTSKNVECPKDPKQIKQQPVMIDTENK
jgi:hypothetical protein